MTKSVFIVMQQRTTIAGSQPLAWLVVHDSEGVCSIESSHAKSPQQAEFLFEIVDNEVLNTAAMATHIYCASPNTAANNRAWPFVGPHMTRASRHPVRRSRTSMGVSSFARPNRLR